MGSFGHRLVIGPGGSGTSHRMTAWSASLHDDVGRALDPAGARLGTVPELVEVRGDPVVPPAPGVAERLRAAVARGDMLVIVHDLHWLPDDLLIELVHAADVVDVWASRRPWPVSDLIRSLDDRLTASRPAERLGAMTIDELAPIVAQRTGRAAPSDLVDALRQFGGGLAGPVCDALDEGWTPEVRGWPDAPLPIGLRDRLLRRVARAGTAAVAIARILAVEPDLDRALADRLALAAGGGVAAGTALRAAAAGGLFDAEDRLIPLIGRAVVEDLTEAEVAEIHGRLADALADIDQRQAIDHAVAGVAHAGGRHDELLAAIRSELVRDPGRAEVLLDRARAGGADPSKVALLEAELHLRAGRTEAIAALGRIGEVSPFDPEAARLEAAVDLRSGRWDRVATRLRPGHESVQPDTSDPIGRDLEAMRHLAGLLVIADPPTEIDAIGRGPIETMVGALVDVLAGRHVEAFRRAVEAADDEIATGDEQLVGVGASILAGLLALTIGELATAESMLDRSAIAGRPAGEGASTRALHRYVALRRARSGAMAGGVLTGADPVGDGPNGDRPNEQPASGWARDQLLDAAIDAAVARRTADTVRLRDAWALADAALVRVHPTWLSIEPLSELLVTGARLGRTDRVQPVVAAIRDQVERGASADGAVAASLAWTELHLAVAAGDLDAAGVAVDRLRSSAVASTHARARAMAGATWLRVTSGIIDETEVLAAVDALLEVDEGWEAARLAGQAALDTDDPTLTRRLLERARTAAPDPTPARATGRGDADGLVALGLSEREAEVARLVADGRTYKEIGAELYISAKTVEHHVARIRQKLGASTRAELLATVRAHDRGIR